MPSRSRSRSPRSTGHRRSSVWQSTWKCAPSLARVEPFRIWGSPRPRNRSSERLSTTSGASGTSGRTARGQTRQQQPVMSHITRTIRNDRETQGSTDQPLQHQPTRPQAEATPGSGQESLHHTPTDGHEARFQVESIELGITPESIARRTFNQVQIISDEGIVTRRIQIGRTLKIYVTVSPRGTADRTGGTSTS